MQSSLPEGPEQRQKRLLALCSRDLDHDLTPREKAEYDSLRVEFPGAAERFESDARGLGGLLRQMTVSEVPATLQEGVAKCIGQTLPLQRTQPLQRTLPRLTRRAAAQPAKHSRGRWLVSGVAVSSLLVCLAASILMSREDPHSGSLASATGARATAEDTQRTDSATAELSPLLPPRKVNVPPLPGEEILVHAEDWQIVVLHLSATDRTAVEQRLAELKAMPDMQISPLPAAPVVESPSSAYDFILTSDRVESRMFVDAVVGAGIGDNVEWNPPSIAEMDSEDLIRSVLESMQSPSLSEQYFGTMYMATRTPPADTASVLMADAGAAARTQETANPGLPNAVASSDAADRRVAPDADSETDSVADSGAGRSSRAQNSGGSTVRELESHDPASGTSGPPEDASTVVAIGGGLPPATAEGKLEPPGGHYVLVVLEFKSPPADADCETPAFQL